VIKSNKILIFKLLFICASIILSIGLVEGAMRIYADSEKKDLDSRCKDFNPTKFLESISYSQVHYHYKPFDNVVHCNSEFNYTYHIDKNGFRNYKTGQKKKDILAIGDSFTFGFGVKDEEAFPALLNAYNAGMWGNPFNFQFEAFKRDTALTKPSIVLWGIYPAHIISMMPHEWSEICPGDARYLSDNSISNQIMRKLLEKFILPIWNSSAIAQFIMKHEAINKISIEGDALLVRTDCYLTKEILIYDKNLVNNTYTFDKNANKTLLKDRDDIYKKVKRYFTEAKRISDEENIKVYFLLFPSKLYLNLKDGGLVIHQKDAKIDADLSIKMMRKIIIEDGYKEENIIDLAKFFLREGNWREYYLPIDAHWNAKGQKFVADVIKSHLNHEKE